MAKQTEWQAKRTIQLVQDLKAVMERAPVPTQVNGFFKVWALGRTVRLAVSNTRAVAVNSST